MSNYPDDIRQYDNDYRSPFFVQPPIACGCCHQMCDLDNMEESKLTDKLFCDDDCKDEFELESYIELKEMKKIVLSELDKMEIEQKEVYLLKEYGGLSYKEISETLEIEINLVKSRLYKVRQKLINRISKLV